MKFLSQVLFLTSIFNITAFADTQDIKFHDLDKINSVATVKEVIFKKKDFGWPGGGPDRVIVLEVTIDSCIPIAASLETMGRRQELKFLSFAQRIDKPLSSGCLKKVEYLWDPLLISKKNKKEKHILKIIGDGDFVLEVSANVFRTKGAPLAGALEADIIDYDNIQVRKRN